MWKQMVQDLHEHGMTYTAIGKIIGLRRNSVFCIGTGDTKQPKGESAIALAKLHKRLLAKARRDAA